MAPYGSRMATRGHQELKNSEIYTFNTDNFVLTSGSIELMDLIYCPFSKNCKNCKISNQFVLQDTEKRQFPVLKYMLDGCRFKVFNCNKLIVDLPKYNKIYDLRALKPSEYCNFLAELPINDLKESIPNHTNGNFIKGTI